MSKQQMSNELKTLEARAAAAQAAYDDAQAAVGVGELYAKNLETDYREALTDPRDFDRLTDLQAKRSAVGAVLADLQTVRDTADKENDEANEQLRHETRLQQALEDLSPRAQALIQTWKAGTLPSRVRLSSGEYALPSMVGNFVDEMRRGSVDRVRQQLEDVAKRVKISE